MVVEVTIKRYEMFLGQSSGGTKTFEVEDLDEAKQVALEHAKKHDLLPQPQHKWKKVCDQIHSIGPPYGMDIDQEKNVSVAGNYISIFFPEETQ